MHPRGDGRITGPPQLARAHRRMRPSSAMQERRSGPGRGPGRRSTARRRRGQAGRRGRPAEPDRVRGGRMTGADGSGLLGRDGAWCRHLLAPQEDDDVGRPDITRRGLDRRASRRLARPHSGHRASPEQVNCPFRHAPTLSAPWSCPLPLVMGVLNVTPDSFSDGGRLPRSRCGARPRSAAVGRGRRRVDVGGESTRPGAEPVTRREEHRRVLPVIEALAAEGVPCRSTPARPRSPRPRWRRRPPDERRDAPRLAEVPPPTAWPAWPCTCPGDPARCRTTPATTTWSPRCATTWWHGPTPPGRRGAPRSGSTLASASARPSTTTSPCSPTSTCWWPPATGAGRHEPKAFLGRSRRGRPPRRGVAPTADRLEGSLATAAWAMPARAAHGAGPRRGAPPSGARVPSR